MKRKKSLIKAKSYVTLREKELKGGALSLYLDIYKEGKRSYEFLKLYLQPGSDPLTKELNRNVLTQAESIRTEREKQVLSGKVETLKKDKGAEILLLDFIDSFADTKRQLGKSESSIMNLCCLKAHVREFTNLKKIKSPTMADINLDFCRAFSLYLINDAGVSGSSANEYFAKFVSVLNHAVYEGIIENNPTTRMLAEERPKRAKDTTREYLLANEVRTLIDTPFINDWVDVKKAYLFSCFCGLRISDLESLTWGNIEKNESGATIKKVIVKTRSTIVLPISPAALEWLPERGTATDEDKVFNFPKSRVSIDTYLRIWAAGAGIKKHVTFHTARHTFATMSLTAGVDLYTTSKLLGHSNVSTTQIYAKIIDQKKVDAVNMISDLVKKGGAQ